MMSGNNVDFGDAGKVVDWDAHNQAQSAPYTNNQAADSIDRTHSNISYTGTGRPEQNHESISKHFIAGLLESAQGVGSLLPNPLEDYWKSYEMAGKKAPIPRPSEIDIKKAMGITKPPAWSAQDFAEIGGNLALPLPPITKAAAPVMKAGGKAVSDTLKKGFDYLNPSKNTSEMDELVKKIQDELKNTGQETSKRTPITYEHEPAQQAPGLNAPETNMGETGEINVPQLNATSSNKLGDAISAQFRPTESEFSQIPSNPLHFPEQAKPEIQSEKIANELHHEITGGKEFEQSTQQNAKVLQDIYSKEIEEHNKEYNSVLEKKSVKSANLEGSEYLSKYGKEYEFSDNNLQTANDKFLKNSSIKNAHKLQKELGFEIGYMDKQNFKGNLDQEGRNLLSQYKEMRNTLIDSMHNKLKEIDPKLAKKYHDVGQSWKINVVPFHEDLDLKSIAKGYTNNPTLSQLNSIYKYPEKGIKNIVSKFPEGEKNSIIHLGMNKDIYENTAKDMLSGEKNLRSKGMTSYLSPEQANKFKEIRNATEKESVEGKDYVKNQKLIDELKKSHEEATKSAGKASIEAQKNIDKAKNESDKLVQSMMKEQKKQRELEAKKQELKSKEQKKQYEQKIKEIKKAQEQRTKRLTQLQDQLLKHKNNKKNVIKNIIKGGGKGLMGLGVIDLISKLMGKE